MFYNYKLKNVSLFTSHLRAFSSVSRIFINCLAVKKIPSIYFVIFWDMYRETNKGRILKRKLCNTFRQPVSLQNYPLFTMGKLQ